MKRFLTATSSPFKFASSLSPFITKPPILLQVDNGSINQNDLMQLFNHEVTAIQIKEFYPFQAAKELGKELAEMARNGHADNWKVVTSDRGLETSDVWTMGDYIPYNVAVATNQIDAYFQGVQQDLKRRRRKRLSLSMVSDASSEDNNYDVTDDDKNHKSKEIPMLWPLDQVRLELDEIWAHGATLARDKASGRVMGGGLPRIMFGPTRWKKGFIHADQYAPLSTANGLFSANIYLQLPKREDKGELHIWPLDIRSDLDWYSNQDLLKGMTVQDASSQVKLRKALGDPLIVSVSPGDLVLFCVQRPHAAVGFQHGTRVSLQAFIQYHGSDKRLFIDI